MTRIEIATRILCSGKADNISYAWQLAGELMELDKTIYKEINGVTYKDRTEYPLTSDDVFDLSQRTAERTQQLIDFGFEADEDLIFVKGEVSISPKLIGEYNEKEWGYFLETVVDEGNYDESILPIIKPTEKTPEELMQLMRNQPLQFVPNDFFKGNPYIEFEMDNSICRLYKLSESLDEKNFAEKDLTTKTGAKAVSKDIISSSENKEFELGITIFKK